MKLILHHALKDLRAQRWLVAAWAVVLVATCAIEAFKLDVLFTDQPSTSTSGGPPASTATNMLTYLLVSLAAARVVLTWVLAIRFVHADPVDGSDAFWLTRPVSAKMLLASKGLLVGGLLLLVPGAAAAFAFVMNGLPLTTLPSAVTQWMLVEAIFLLPLALLATMTRDLARMVLAVLLAAAAWATMQTPSSIWMVAAAEVQAMRLVLSTSVVVASAVLAGQQYLSRRTARTAVSSVAALVVIIVVAAAWPLRAALGRGHALEPEWAGAASISIRVPADSLGIRTTSYYRAGVQEKVSVVLGDIRVDGLSKDSLVSLGRGRGSLVVTGTAAPLYDRYVYAVGFGFRAGDLADPASRGHFERAIEARLIPRSSLSGKLQLLRIATAAEYEKYQGRPGRYEAKLEINGLRIGSIASAPLRAGASAVLNGVETTVLSIHKARTTRAGEQSPRWTIALRSAAPRAWLSRPAVEFLLRNRRRGEAIVIWYDRASRRKNSLGENFVNAASGVASFYPGPAEGAIDEAWLSDAELVMVSLEPLGRSEKTITIPSFTLPPPPAEEGGKGEGGKGEKR